MPTTPDSTFARLLEKAATLFRTKGYAGTTTRELASLLGIQSASLYYHISKKEDLLYALCVDALEHTRREVEQAIAQHADPVERVRALIRAHTTTLLADRDKHATALFELRSLSDERRARVVELRDAHQALVHQAIAEAQAAGGIRQDIDAKHLTLGLLNLLNWSVFWFKPGGGLSPEELGDLLATLFIEGAVLRHSPTAAGRSSA